MHKHFPMAFCLTACLLAWGLILGQLAEPSYPDRHTMTEYPGP